MRLILLLFYLAPLAVVCSEFGDRIRNDEESKKEIEDRGLVETSQLNISPFIISSTDNKVETTTKDINSNSKYEEHHINKAAAIVQANPDQSFPSSSSVNVFSVQDEGRERPKTINLTDNNQPRSLNTGETKGNEYGSQSYSKQEVRAPYKRLRDRVNYIHVKRNRKTSPRPPRFEKGKDSSSPNAKLRKSFNHQRKRKLKRRKPKHESFVDDFNSSNGDNYRPQEIKPSDKTSDNILDSTKSIIEKAELQMHKQDSSPSLTRPGVLMNSMQRAKNVRNHNGSQGSSTTVEETVMGPYSLSEPLEMRTKSANQNLYREDIKDERNSAWPLRRPNFERKLTSSLNHGPSKSKNTREKSQENRSTGFVDDINAFGVFLKGFPHGVQNFQMASLKDNLKSPAKEKLNTQDKEAYRYRSSLPQLQPKPADQLSFENYIDEHKISSHDFRKIKDDQEDLNLVPGGRFYSQKPSFELSSSEQQDSLVPIPFYGNSDNLSNMRGNPMNSQSFQVSNSADRPHKGYVESILLNEGNKEEVSIAQNSIPQNKPSQHKSPVFPTSHSTNQRPRLNVNPPLMNTLHQQRPRPRPSSTPGGRHSSSPGGRPYSHPGGRPSSSNGGRRPPHSSTRPLFRVPRPMMRSKDTRSQFRQLPPRLSLPKFLMPPPLLNNDQTGSHLTNVPVNAPPSGLTKNPLTVNYSNLPKRGPFYKNHHHRKRLPDSHLIQNVIPSSHSVYHTSKPHSPHYHHLDQITYTSPSIPTASTPLRAPFYATTKSPHFNQGHSSRHPVFSLSPNKRRNRPPRYKQSPFPPYKLPLYTPQNYLRPKQPMSSHFKVIRDDSRHQDEVSFQVNSPKQARAQYRNAVTEPIEPYVSESEQLDTSSKNMIDIKEDELSKQEPMSQPLPKEIMQNREKKMPESHRSMLQSLKYGINGEPLDVWIPIRSQEEINRSK